MILYYLDIFQINQVNPDVIGFQEVRTDAKDQRNQLTELQELIPQYKHLVYHPVAMVTPPLGQQVPPGWEMEGLGLLSKHPIIMSHIVNLTVGKGSVDRNKRVVLHAQVDIDGDELDITVVHFSYDKTQQCQNAIDVINYIASIGSERSVLVGDFNVYNDFPWPVDGILKGSFDKQGSCDTPPYFNPQGSNQGYGFVDAWVTANGDHRGYTFSNMVRGTCVTKHCTTFGQNITFFVQISVELPTPWVKLLIKVVAKVGEHGRIELTLCYHSQFKLLNCA